MAPISLRRSLLICIAIAAWAATGAAHAVPSYARAMNTPCSTCHTLYPQLNAFGRQFKLDAYALGAGTAKPIEAEGAGLIVRFTVRPE